MEKVEINEVDIVKCQEFFKKFQHAVYETINAPVERPQEPKVAEGVEEEYVGLAEKLVEIQKETGSIFPKNLTDAELVRLKRLAKKNNISTKEAVAMLVENENYISKDVADTNGLVRVFDDIKNIAETSGKEINAIPVSLLSEGSRAFLVNKRFNLPLKNIVEEFIKIYLPEYQHIRVSSSEIRPKITGNKKHHLNNLQDFEEILAKEFADKSGNIDSIFKPENKDILKQLIFALNNSNVTFDNYMNMTGMTYTKIYRLEPLVAIRHMLKQYFNKYKTFKDITTNDPFLRKKIDVAEEVSNIHSLNELLEHLGLPTVAGESLKKTSAYKIDTREAKLIDVLIEEFPDKFIPEKTYKTHEKLSDEIVYMAKRRGFDYADDYLKSIGFVRNSKQQIKLAEAKFLMTEEDLLHYNFIEKENIKQFDKIIEKFNGELATVENNYSTYSMLLFGEKYQTKHKADYQNIEKPVYFG